MSNEERDRLTQSITALTAEHDAVKLSYEAALKQRVYAEHVEQQLHKELDSLMKLIEIRTERLAPYLSEPPAKQLDLVVAVEAPTTPASAATDDSAPESSSDKEGEGEEINRVNWIFDLVEKSGPRGIIPPDASRAAHEAGIRMHNNYPYTALKVLLKRDLIIKRRGRYYKKPIF